MELKINKFPKVKVDPNMKDYSNHPYFLRKVDEMKDFLNATGIPEDILKRQAVRSKK